MWVSVAGMVRGLQFLSLPTSARRSWGGTSQLSVWGKHALDLASASAECEVVGRLVVGGKVRQIWLLGDGPRGMYCTPYARFISNHMPLSLHLPHVSIIHPQLYVQPYQSAAGSDIQKPLVIVW